MSGVTWLLTRAWSCKRPTRAVFFTAYERRAELAYTEAQEASHLMTEDIWFLLAKKPLQLVGWLWLVQ